VDVDAAKANPEKISIAPSGVMSINHLTTLMVERLSGAKFAKVHFDGTAPSLTALLGGHVNAASVMISDAIPKVKSGDIRVLGTTDTEPSEFLPDAKTMESQGLKINLISSHVVVAPAGAPKEFVGIMDKAVKKALDSDEVKSRMRAVSLNIRYLSSAQLADLREQMDEEVLPIMDEVATT
jgi:tripartite-type tricarboxylate transporter receptor subunit TctC